MNTALLFGCGSKWGASFATYLADQNVQIDLITSTGLEYKNINNIKIDWHNISLKEILQPLMKNTYDFIFFNHQSYGPGLDAFEDDNILFDLDTYYNITCQIPFSTIKILKQSINEQTKICWVLTGLIDGNNPKFRIYPGYAITKSINYHIMLGFSTSNYPGIYFCLNPGWFPSDKFTEDSMSIFNFIQTITQEHDGCIFYKDGKQQKMILE